MHFIKILGLSTFYQVVIFTRLKQAVFFSVFFPIFLYVVFNSLWGNTGSEYSFYLLTGVITMLIASDGFFAIGPVIKQFYANGFIKYVKKMPIHIVVHFLSLVLSRFILIIIEIFFLILIGVLFFGVEIDAYGVLRILWGGLIGLSIFSFLGLSLSFLDLKSGGERSLTSILYFSMLFTSEAFYPAKMLNSVIGTIGDYLPFNGLLHIMRMDESPNWFVIAFWVFVPMMIFIILFNRSKVAR